MIDLYLNDNNAYSNNEYCQIKGKKIYEEAIGRYSMGTWYI